MGTGDVAHVLWMRGPSSNPTGYFASSDAPGGSWLAHGSAVKALRKTTKTHAMKRRVVESPWRRDKGLMTL